MCSIRIIVFIFVGQIAAPLCALTITTDTIISAENSFPGERLGIADGESPPTVVQMIDGGEAQSIGLLGASILNFNGGNVSEYVSAGGTSTVNVRGGRMRSLIVRDNAVGNIFGGTIESGVGIGTGFGSLSTLNIFGGEIHGNVGPDARGGMLNIHGGRMESLFSTVLVDSTINVTGGSLSSFNLHGGKTVHWSGGELREEYALLQDETILNVYGRDLAFNDPHLTGTLLDGTVLEDYYIDRHDNAQIILHNVPEPSSLALLTVASITAFSLRRKRICVH